MAAARETRLGDPALRYIVETRPLHEIFQQVLTQVAGLALLVMTRRGVVPQVDGPLQQAQASLAEADDRLRSLRVPAAAGHHHHHVVATAGAVGRALRLLLDCLKPDADDAARAALSRMLKVATEHLRASTRALPGFEMVDLSQACCATHAVPQPLICE